jgi:small subunit ribosomal protein S14
MTRKALIAKCNRRKLRAARQRANGQKVTFSTRIYSQCIVTGRRRGVIGRFGLSRIELRERVNRGEILGVRKSSW